MYDIKQWKIFFKKTSEREPSKSLWGNKKPDTGLFQTLTEDIYIVSQFGVMVKGIRLETRWLLFQVLPQVQSQLGDRLSHPQEEGWGKNVLKNVA